MNIAVYHKKEYAGTGLYRLWLPHEKLVEMGHNVVFTDSVNIRDYDNIDLFIASKSWFLPAVSLVADLNRRGTPTIIDFDDYWSVPPSHILYDNYRQYRVPYMLVGALKLFKHVSCTTERLQAEIRTLNKSCEVFENAIDPDNPQFKIIDKNLSGVHFGWIGGHCHLPDIEILRGTGGKLSGDFTIHLFGHDGLRKGIKKFLFGHKPSLYDKFGELISDGGRLKGDFVVHGMKPAREYTQYYNEINVALAPLRPDKFNSMKSELKAVEAGFFRKAVIASDVAPYNTILNSTNSMLCGHRNNWADAMQYLIDNPAYVEDIGWELYHTVRRKFDLNVVTQRREEWYKTLV